MASPGEIEKLERRWLENMQGLTFAPLAEAYRKAGRLDEAFRTLELGLAHHPDYVPAHIVRGRCALDSGDDTVAASAFALVLSFDSLNLIALRGLAEISVRSGHQQDAILHLRRLLEADPTDAEALAQLAELQTRATPASAADYAPSPVPDEAPPSREESLSAETVFPLVDLDGSEAPVEPPHDHRTTDDLGQECVDPLDLRLDEQWASHGAGHEYVLGNDSETLIPSAHVLDPHGEEESEEGSYPSIDINVVPTLKDLAEAEPPIAESEGDPEASAISVDMAPESDLDEALGQDSHDRGGEMMQLLENEEEVPIHPWTPAIFPPPTAGMSDARAEDAAPPEILDDVEPEAWPEGPLAVSGTDVSGEDQETTALPCAPSNTRDTPEAEGEDSPEVFPEEAFHESIDASLPEEEAALAAPMDSPELESTPYPGGWGGWMSDGGDRAETTEPDSPELPPGESPEDDREGTLEDAVAEEPNPVMTEEEGAAADLVVTEEEESVDADLVVTETMAEIFLRQGHDELALAVYTELARRDPANSRLQEAIARLAPTPAAETNPPPVSSGPARYAASSTGGESLGDFLAGVLAVREPISPLAITPPAMDRPREGEPTRPADTHFGLDSVFGDDPSDTSVPPAATEEGEGISPSFDEFFGERPPVVAPPSTTSSESDSEDLQHFNDWLKGLKR